LRHPSEFYLRFLLSRQQHSYDEITAMCELADVGAPAPEYLDQIDAVVMENRPVPFRGHDLRHVASQRYLRKLGIAEAWNKNRYMKEAIALLGNSQVRSLMETFILSPLKPSQAVGKIRKSIGYDLPEQVYDLFRHYFWNDLLLNMEEWAEFIPHRRVSHQEWLRLAVTARGPKGVQLLLWKTGTGPIRHADSGKIFKHLRNVAYMKALELEFEPATKDVSTAFKNFVQAAKMSQEEVNTSEAAMTDVLDSFQAFKMKTVVSQVPSLLELTDGSFSEAEDVTGSEDKINMDDY